MTALGVPAMRTVVLLKVTGRVTQGGTEPAAELNVMTKLWHEALRQHDNGINLVPGLATTTGTLTFTFTTAATIPSGSIAIVFQSTQYLASAGAFTSTMGTTPTFSPLLRCRQASPLLLVAALVPWQYRQLHQPVFRKQST
jgi:hypothetical protein